MKGITLELVTNEYGYIKPKNTHDDLMIFSHCSSGDIAVSRERFFSQTRLILELHGVKYTLDGYPQ